MVDMPASIQARSSAVGCSVSEAPIRRCRSARSRWVSSSSWVSPSSSARRFSASRVDRVTRIVVESRIRHSMHRAYASVKRRSARDRSGRCWRGKNALTSCVVVVRNGLGIAATSVAPLDVEGPAAVTLGDLFVAVEGVLETRATRRGCGATARPCCATAVANESEPERRTLTNRTTLITTTRTGASSRRMMSPKITL